MVNNFKISKLSVMCIPEALGNIRTVQRQAVSQRPRENQSETKPITASGILRLQSPPYRTGPRSPPLPAPQRRAPPHARRCPTGEPLRLPMQPLRPPEHPDLEVEHQNPTSPYIILPQPSHGWSHVAYAGATAGARCPQPAHQSLHSMLLRPSRTEYFLSAFQSLISTMA